MSLLHCSDSAVTHALRTAAPEAALRVIPEWSDFERAAPGAALLVVHTTMAQAQHAAARIAALRKRCPLQPLVVVAPRDPNVLLLLLNVGISEMVWADAPTDEMRGTLIRARGQGLLERVAALIERSQAASAAFRSTTPPRRANDLAALAHCDRTTLWKQWRSAFGASTSFTPGRFVDWLLLVHAVVRKAAGRKWSDVAGELGIHEHTVGRLARRCAGMQLRQLEGEGHDTLVQRLQSDVLAHFAKPGNETHLSGNVLLLKEMAGPGILVSSERGADLQPIAA